MQQELDLKEKQTYSFNQRMYCSNLANITVTYTVPSESDQKSYPSYRSTNFHLEIQSIFVLGRDRLAEYLVDNVESINNITERANLELEMLIYWKDL